MKTLKKILPLCICITFFLPLVAKTVTVKVASVAPARSPWEAEEFAMAKDWSDLTNGQVKLKFYNAATMGGEAGIINKIKSIRPGQRSPINGAIFTNIGADSMFPDSHAMTFCVPFMFHNQDEMDYILEATYDEVNAGIEKDGYVLLGWFNIGWANFFAKTEARTPKLLKECKMGFAGITSPKLLSSFRYAGFQVLQVPPDKVLASLNSPSGISASYAIPMFVYAAQHYTALNYFIDTPLCPAMAAFVIDKKTWDSIDDEYKPLLRKNLKKYEAKFTGIQQETDTKYLNILEKEGGLERIVLTDEELKLWQDELHDDAVKIAELENGAFNGPFYTKIVNMLAEYRNK